MTGCGLISPRVTLHNERVSVGCALALLAKNHGQWHTPAMKRYWPFVCLAGVLIAAWSLFVLYFLPRLVYWLVEREFPTPAW
jgi:hypothetical protein